MTETALTENGKRFMEHARTLQGGALLDVDHSLSLDADGHRYPDDLTDPVVSLVSTISRSERARRFGVECLSLRDWSGKPCGPQGHAIPSEEYIARIVVAYDDEPEYRIITLDPYRELPLPRAINRAGNDLIQMLDRGCYKIKD